MTETQFSTKTPAKKTKNGDEHPSIEISPVPVSAARDHSPAEYPDTAGRKEHDRPHPEDPPATDNVRSRIRPQVVYAVKRAIYPEDCDIELAVYELHEFGTNFLVVLGKPKYTYSAQGILYVPIYFIPPQSQAPKLQIGVYEYERDRAVAVLDQDGDLDIHALVPLFYPFAEDHVRTHPGNVADMLSKGLTPRGQGSAEGEAEAEGEDDDEAVSEASSDNDTDVLHLSKAKASRISDKPPSKTTTADTTSPHDDGIFTVQRMTVPPPTLPKESREDADRLKSEYRSSSNDPWIQTFMRNHHYQIHPVENNGDCFFATIRDAYRSIGMNTTVAKLRDILAKEVTYDIFQENRKLFLDLDGSKKEYDRELKAMKEGSAALEKRFKTTPSRERESVRAELTQIANKYNETMTLRQTTDRIMKETMGDLSHITTFDQYQAYLKTPAYWADAWAISTLEKALNMKVVIFSEGSYREDAVHSVLNCGEVNRDLEKRGVFAPLYYIMVTYSGVHYELLSYKTKKIFTFPEIPYDVKTMVVNKCIEKNAGIYYLIDDFRQFKLELGIQPDVGAPEDTTESETMHAEGSEEATSSVDLYDASVVFRFFAKSENSPLPGKGAGESITKDKMVDYKDLKTVPNWRRKLDDTWILDASHALVLDGHQYASVEHYYQASKFQYPGAPPANQEFAQLFTLDSGNRIGRDVGLAVSAGSKSGKHRAKDGGEKGDKDEEGAAVKKTKDVLLRPKTVTIDPQFYAGRSDQERRRALVAKFQDNPEMKRLLHMTKRAKLVHYIAKHPPEADLPLMDIRRTLTANTP